MVRPIGRSLMVVASDCYLQKIESKAIMKAWNYKITKPNSRIDPSIIKSIFKGFLHRAHEICLDKYIKEEIVFNMSFCREWT